MWLLLLLLDKVDHSIQECISEVAELLLLLLLDNGDHSIQECIQKDVVLWLWMSWAVGNEGPLIRVYISKVVLLL